MQSLTSGINRTQDDPGKLMKNSGKNGSMPKYLVELIFRIDLIKNNIDIRKFN